MTRFQQYCQRQQQLYGERFVAPTDYRWIDAYNRGPSYRVQVRLRDGRVVWGYVGITTGWQPVFLLMRSTRAVGSSTTLGTEDMIMQSHYLRARRRCA